MSQRYTITAALPYANGPVHIGHLAGVYIPADIYTRYLRLKKKDVVFVCGSDEHGVPVTIRAQKEGISTQEVVDKYHQIIGDSFKEFGIAFDIYHRTSSPTHKETASEFFQFLHEKGEFVEQESEQLYDEQFNQFLADRYVKGECPHCGNPEAYGDQCENCGSTLSPSELKNPVSALSGAVPIKKKTKHWYLPLDKYEEWLSEWILKDHKDWKSNVYGQCKSWIDQGLKPRAVTRDLDWGVPVPVEGADGKVLYVWFDAPIGYISATKAWAEEHGKDWQPYWKDEETKLIHFIGKDNIVFHCIIFPSMLKAHGDYILPENVPANEFLNLEGDKISTSRDWAVWLHEYLQDFPDKQDILRYTLCANAPETKDNDFTWKDFQTRNNSELVAIFGNFVNRTIVLTHKYFDGSIPAKNELFNIDNQLVEKINQTPALIERSLENYKFRDALSQLIDLARAGNKYLADTEPWKLIKENPERVATILNISLQLSANLAILSQPFLPFTAKKLADMLNSPLDWELAGSSDDCLKEGHTINKASLLFEKIEDDVIEQQIEKLKRKSEEKTQPQNSIPMEAEEIAFDDFTKLDIRIGTVTHAEKVPKTDKLMKLTVNLGSVERTVVSGIALYHKAEDIVGKQVTVLVNLAPRKLRGILSQGMILMAEDYDGTLKFISPDNEVTNGSKIS